MGLGSRFFHRPKQLEPDILAHLNTGPSQREAAKYVDLFDVGSGTTRRVTLPRRPLLASWSIGGEALVVYGEPGADADNVMIVG